MTVDDAFDELEHPLNLRACSSERLKLSSFVQPLSRRDAHRHHSPPGVKNAAKELWRRCASICNATSAFSKGVDWGPTQVRFFILK